MECSSVRPSRDSCGRGVTLRARLQRRTSHHGRLRMDRPVTVSTSTLRVAFNWRALTLAGLVLTLALLPFEDQLPAAIGFGTWTVTGLEFVWVATIATWAMWHVTERTMPRLPLVLVLGFGA